MCRGGGGRELGGWGALANFAEHLLMYSIVYCSQVVYNGIVPATVKLHYSSAFHRYIIIVGFKGNWVSYRLPHYSIGKCKFYKLASHYTLTVTSFTEQLQKYALLWAYLDCLMQVHSSHFSHTVLDHL